MKICFVDPKGVHFGLNTGLGYLVSVLKQMPSVEAVKVYDFNNNGHDIERRIEEIRGFDVIGFSIKSFTRDSALHIAQRVKTEKNILLAGGPHITLDGVNFLKENGVFDFGIAGEGEEALPQLLNAVAARSPVAGINGLIYRDNGHVVRAGSGSRIVELDGIPYPDYSVFDSVVDGKIYNYPLVTSRGCPYQCIYCCVKVVMGRKWVPRSVENVMGELAHAKKTYGITCFNIQDDNFSMDMDRAKDFCDCLISTGLAMKWSCPNGIRADKVDDVLMGRMRAAGCFGVAMGIESGVEEEFRAIKKGETLGDIINAVGLAQKNRIMVFGNFIIGLPHSSLDSIRQSIRFARSLKLESCIFNLFIPFPGTEIWEWVQNNGRLLMDWKDGFTQGLSPRVVFETTDFPAEERLQAYYEANIKCHNYFAFMNEQESLARNIINVVKTIMRHDARNSLRHMLWVIRHSRRIGARILEKNT